MNFRIQLALIFFCQIVILPDIGAQISASGQSFTDSTSYPVFDQKDPIFVYNSSCAGGANQITSLTAVAPSNLDSCDYSWTAFNSLTGSFDIAVKTEFNVSLSQVSGLVQGGYQVHITKGIQLDTSFRCWIFIHGLSVSLLKTSDGKLPASKFTCNYVQLNGYLETDTFHYYDPASGQPITLKNNTFFSWSYNNKETIHSNVYPFGANFNNQSDLSPRDATPPPYDTHYYLVATDKFGAKCSDTVLYISIQTRSKFEYKYYDHYGDTTGFYPMDPQGESAPARFQFINHSVNGATYQWILTDTVFAGDSAFRIVNANDTLLKPEYTYYFPREQGYLAKLISRSAKHCADTSVNQILIIVKPSELATIPNVFTPNNDGKNDFFIFYPYDENVAGSPASRFASIKVFHILISDRWGRKVHEFYGDINDWVGNGKTGSSGGWDGKVLDSNTDAVPGIYYYIIEATGWDNTVYKGQKRQYMGYLYLFR